MLTPQLTLLEGYFISVSINPSISKKIINLSERGTISRNLPYKFLEDNVESTAFKAKYHKTTRVTSEGQHKKYTHHVKSRQITSKLDQRHIHNKGEF